MSTKPSPSSRPSAARTAPAPASLTERRKAATQLEIAHAAAELFTELGPDATTTEAIAARAGVGLRTFYRYFRNKQDAVGPLLAVGGAQWRARLAATEPGTPLPAALRSAVTDALTPADDAAADGLRQARGLLRAAAEDPALRAVWYRVNQESEEQLLPVLASLMGPDTDPLRVRLAAATATASIRIALETWADPDPDSAPEKGAGADSGGDSDVRGPGSPAHLAEECLRALMPE